MREGDTYVVGDDHAAFSCDVLREESRLLEEARANINGVGSITQVDIHGHHASRVCGCGAGCGHASGGGTGRDADGGGGEEEGMDEVGEEAEEEEGAAGHRHCSLPRSGGRAAACGYRIENR